MNEPRPLSGILMLVAAVGIAWAWTHGHLNGVAAKIGELLANPVQPNPTVLTPLTGGRFGDQWGRGQ